MQAKRIVKKQYVSSCGASTAKSLKTKNKKAKLTQ
jgi:hypothetical protein